MKSIIYLFLIIYVFSCDRITEPPMATLEVYPHRGDSLTLYELSAERSEDDVTLFSALEYRWDFNGDGIWDTDYNRMSKLVRYFPDPDKYIISVQVRDEDGLTCVALDTISVFGENRDTSYLTDIRDGQRYKIVCLNGRWWMAENLRYGASIDPWTGMQADNGIVENYKLWDIFQNEYFYTYTWYEAVDHKMNNPKGICPDGWHLPSQQEWETLSEGFPVFYCQEYYNEGGWSKLELSKGDEFFIHRTDRLLGSQGTARYWSYEYKKQDYKAAGYFSTNNYKFYWYPDINLDFDDQLQVVLTMRCIKDSL